NIWCARNAALLNIRTPCKPRTDTPTEPMEFDSRIPLGSCDIEAMIAKLPPLTRRGIRKSFKAGLAVNFGGQNLLTDLYYILYATRRRIGLPLPRQDYYAAILEQLDAGILCIYHRGTPLSGCLYLRDPHHLHYAVPGTTTEGRRLGAGDRLLRELLVHAGESGCQEVCLGGSPASHSGLMAFKARWGSIQTPIYQYGTQSVARGPSRILASFVKMLPKTAIGPITRLLIRHLY
ncbi:MAG: GNAT family N-acetyltransferase, partial [Gammaproteobacteria bacterium]